MANTTLDRPIRHRSFTCESLEEVRARREALEQQLFERLARYNAQVLAMQSRFNVEIDLKEMRDLAHIQEMEARLRQLRACEKRLKGDLHSKRAA